jgi:hypothetical protein
MNVPPWSTSESRSPGSQRIDLFFSTVLDTSWCGLHIIIEVHRVDCASIWIKENLENSSRTKANADVFPFTHAADYDALATTELRVHVSVR